jgi:hypothetical protein
MVPLHRASAVGIGITLVLGIGFIVGHLAKPSTIHHSISQTKTRDFLDEEMRDLEKGFIGFDAPPEMTQGRQGKVSVVITRNLNQDVLNLLKDHMQDQLPSTVQVQEIQVAPFMTAQLHGADDTTFKIIPLTQDKQAVAAEGYTSWAWSVTPLKSGPQILYLSVGARFKLPNRDEETRFIPLYEKEVTVQVDRIYETKQFLSGNWQWLTATLLIPLGGFIWHNWKRKPKQTELTP